MESKQQEHILWQQQHAATGAAICMICGSLWPLGFRPLKDLCYRRFCNPYSTLSHCNKSILCSPYGMQQERLVALSAASSIAVTNPQAFWVPPCSAEQHIA